MMDSEQSPEAITENAAWEAYTFGKDLLVAVRATLAAAKDAGNLFGSTPAAAVVEKAARAYSLIQSRGAAVQGLVDASGWSDNPARYVGTLDLEDVPPVCFVAHDLKEAAGAAEKWLRSIMCKADACEADPRSVAKFAVDMSSFAWSLGDAVERLGSFRSIEDRIVRARIVSYATDTADEQQRPAQAATDSDGGSNVAEIATSVGADEADEAEEGGVERLRAPAAQPKPLSEGAKKVLETMYRMGAAIDSPFSQPVISIEAFAKEVEIKRMVRALKCEGLADSKKNLGTWLTEKGVRRAAEITGKTDAAKNKRQISG